MILDVSNIDHIYIISGPTDFRKGMMSLAALVRDVYNLDPFSDSVFIFSNRNRKSIKVLHWYVNGFELYAKTITTDSKYQWPRDSSTKAKRISKKQLHWLLDGLTMEQAKAFTDSNQHQF